MFVSCRVLALDFERCPRVFIRLANFVWDSDQLVRHRHPLCSLHTRLGQQLNPAVVRSGQLRGGVAEGPREEGKGHIAGDLAPSGTEELRESLQFPLTDFMPAGMKGGFDAAALTAEVGNQPLGQRKRADRVALAGGDQDLLALQPFVCLRLPGIRGCKSATFSNRSGCSNITEARILAPLE